MSHTGPGAYDLCVGRFSGKRGHLVGTRVAYSFILVMSVELIEGEAMCKGHGADTVLALLSPPASVETVKQGQ